MKREEILSRYNSIIENIERIKQKYSISYDVNIAAVSKYSSLDTIKEFLSLNIDLPLAESKAQSLRDRAGEIAEIKDNVKWHFIGRIQNNKVKYIVKYVLDRCPNEIEFFNKFDKYPIKHLN